MSGDDDLFGELDLDLESALDEWEAEFDRLGVVQSESDPMPQKTEGGPAVPSDPHRPSAPAHAAPRSSRPSKPLYQPASQPPPSRPVPMADLDFDDGADAATRIADIPRDLIDSLQEKYDTEGKAADATTEEIIDLDLHDFDPADMPTGVYEQPPPLPARGAAPAPVAIHDDEDEQEPPTAIDVSMDDDLLDDLLPSPPTPVPAASDEGAAEPTPPPLPVPAPPPLPQRAPIAAGAPSGPTPAPGEPAPRPTPDPAEPAPPPLHDAPAGTADGPARAKPPAPPPSLSAGARRLSTAPPREPADGRSVLDSLEPLRSGAGEAEPATTEPRESPASEAQPAPAEAQPAPAEAQPAPAEAQPAPAAGAEAPARPAYKPPAPPPPSLGDPDSGLAELAAAVDMAVAELDMADALSSAPPPAAPWSEEPPRTSGDATPPETPGDIAAESVRPPAADASPDPDDDDAEITVGPASDLPDVDLGAETAARTVQYRKPRAELFPLVGRDEDASRARCELLLKLAEGATGSTKARLLVAAGELAEQAGEGERAAALYASAHEADRKDVVALRATRRAAARRGAWPEVAALLGAETSLPLSAVEKASVLTHLAEVQLTRLREPAAAERSARAAMAVRGGSVATPLLLAEACFAQDRKLEGMGALEKVVEGWKDPACRAAVLADLARSAELAGHLKRARSYFDRAAESDPRSLDIALGVARTSRREGLLDEAVTTLRGAAEQCTSAQLREALLRSAAQLYVKAGRHAAAVELLGDARGVLALRTRADAAAAADDRESQRQAVEAWANATGGTERALALVTLAELLADGGDLDAADTALRDAALADEALGTIRVVREVLARKAGDSSRLAKAVGASEGGIPGGALVAAAKIASDVAALPQERDALLRALDEGESPVCADVLSLDSAAEADDLDAVRAALRRQASRATPQHKPGPLMTLIRMVADEGDADRVEALLREVQEVSPGNPLALRPLARLISMRSPKDGAALWLEEASIAEGTRSAFAACEAGRLLRNSDAEAALAFRRALGDHPSYAPAAWALEPIARRLQDGETLAQLHERLGDNAGDPVEAAGHLVRAGLLRAGEGQEESAANLLRTAHDHAPGDAIIAELRLRLTESTLAEERAALFEAVADNAPPDLARASRLRAAGAWEDAGAHEKAAALYRRVLEDHPADPFAAAAIDRAELAAGQHDGVAARRLAAVEQAGDDASRIAALEALAEFELYERGDAAAGLTALRSLLDLAPDHLPALRWLERHFMKEGHAGDLADVERNLARRLSEPSDVSAHARLAARLLLADAGADGKVAYPVYLDAAGAASEDLWLARRYVAAADGSDRLPEALERVADLLTGPAEKVSTLLVLARERERASGPAAAATLLAPCLHLMPEHPVAAEELGRLREAAGDPAGAAAAYEVAANAVAVPRRRAGLWYRAGTLLQDHGGDEGRALAALQKTADIDPAFLDVFDRIKRLLQARDDTAGLAEITAKRLEAGGDTPVLVELHLTRAELCESLGDTEGARQALRSALAIESERVDALKKLSELCLADEDFRGAAESLIRIARLRKDREELRWVFFTLGDIYDRHMPDPKRAEAAFKRVLKLVPEDLEAMDRLAQVYRRDGDHAQAIDTLSRLAQLEVDPEKNRDYRLALAESLEQQGDLRRAEGALEQTRRQSPTDLTVIRSLADFYQRQNAQSALSMHLNRAVSDLRRAIETDATDAAAWPALVEVLRWRGRPDAARCCASAASAVGVVDVELAKCLDPQGGVPGGGAAAADPTLDDFLSVPALSPSVRRFFSVAHDALDKVLPLDLRALGADKAGRSDVARAAAQPIGQMFGLSDVQVLVSQAAPRLFIPVSGAPATILVGRDIVGAMSEAELRFLLVRTIKLAASHLSLLVRSSPEQLSLLFAGLMRMVDPSSEPGEHEEAAVEDMARRLGKALGKRREQLAPLVLETMGAPGFDASKLGAAAGQLGDRVALLCEGSVPAGVGALLRLRLELVPSVERPSARAQAIRSMSEVWALLGFAVSDVHFEARARIGVDKA